MSSTKTAVIAVGTRPLFGNAQSTVPSTELSSRNMQVN